MSFPIEERRPAGLYGEQVTAPTSRFEDRALALALADLTLALTDPAAFVAGLEQVCRPLRDDDGTVLIPHVADSAAPPPAAAGAPSAVSASPTRPADGAPNCSAADLPAGSRNPALPAAGVTGGAPYSRRVRACALSGAQARVAPPAVAAGDARAGKPDPPPTAQPAPGSGGPGRANTSASHSDEGGGASHAMRASHPQRPSQSFQPFAAADGASPSTTPSDASASRPGWGSGRDVPPDFDTHVDRALTVDDFLVVDPLGPRLVEPAPVADPALREPDRVWIAVRRTGIDRHRLSKTPERSGHTACGRSAYAGHLLPADDPWIAEYTQPCPRCWPGGAR